jgi:hypothetical protein
MVYEQEGDTSMFTYKRIVSIWIMVVLFIIPFGCASSIVEGEHIKTSTTYLAPKKPNAIIEIYFPGKHPVRKWHEVGKIVSRAYVLEKGVEQLKQEARKLGADAVINVRYERKLSVDYLQDLYFITGDGMSSNNLSLPAWTIGDHSSNLYGGFEASYTGEGSSLSEANQERNNAKKMYQV